MKKIKIVSLSLAVLLVCGLFAGCNVFGSKAVMKINGNEISEDIYSAALIYADSMISSTYGMSVSSYLDTDLGFGDGKTGAQFLKENAEEFIKEMESVRIFAKENGLELTDAEKEEIEASKEEQITSAGGRKAYLDQLEANGMNEEFVDYLSECMYLYQKAEGLYMGTGKFAPTKEAVVQKYSNGDYARVKHILIMATEGAEDFEDRRALAEEYAARAASGEDFEALMTEVASLVSDAETGEMHGDPGMTSTPDGYVIDRDGYTPDGSSQMMQEFTDGSFSVEENGVTGIVQTSYGFHIIKRYPIDDAFITANFDEYQYYIGVTDFTNKLMEIVNGMKVEHTKQYDKVDIHEVLGVQKTNGAGVATTTEQHSADDGHDHSTTAQ